MSVQFQRAIVQVPFENLYHNAGRANQNKLSSILFSKLFITQYNGRHLQVDFEIHLADIGRSFLSLPQIYARESFE